jgi:hypothetical protein
MAVSKAVAEAIMALCSIADYQYEYNMSAFLDVDDYFTIRNVSSLLTCYC